VRHEYNVLALIKGEHQYVFVYEDLSQDEAISTFREYAADPLTPFSWFDAAVLTDKVRQQASESTGVNETRPSRLPG
jgi:hypothetical protein